MPAVETLAAEEIDTFEDVFATFQLPIGLLNMDYAGNNIRNVGRVRIVLNDWAIVARGTGARGKQRSELKLLGYAMGSNLTPLGQAALAAASFQEIARLWCAWIQEKSETELASVNPRLLVAKRVFTQFWMLQEEVRNYFLEHSASPSEEDRRTLQVIELLCNASNVVQALSLDEIKAFVPILQHSNRLPQSVRNEVLDYLDNKGVRGWNFPDRRIVPLAWKAARS